MTTDEGPALTPGVSVPALRAYWGAVGQQTVDIIRTYDATEWDKVVDPGRIRRVVRDEGGFGPHVNTQGVEAYYAGMPAAGRLPSWRSPTRGDTSLRGTWTGACLAAPERDTPAAATTL